MSTLIGLAYRQIYVKLTIFLLLPVSALNAVLHNQVVPKTVVLKFSFSKLKIEKVKFFTQSNQIFVHLH